MSFEPKKNSRVLTGISHILCGSDGVSGEMLELGNTFVRYRYQERSSSRLRLFSVVNRKVKAHILTEQNPKLSQHKESVRQDGKAEKAQNNMCG